MKPDIARKRAGLIVELCRLKARHRKRGPLLRLLIKLTTLQIKEEMRAERKRAA